MKFVLVLFVMFFGLCPQAHAQTHTVVDNKGTVQTVTSNRVTRATTPPATAVEADVWVDTTQPTQPVANVWDGTAWRRVTPIATVWAAGRINETGSVNRPLFNATASRVDEGTYDIVFSNPLPTADYVILLTLRHTNANSGDYKVSYELQTSTGFRVQVGDNDNGATARRDRDLQFTFVVIDY